MILFMNGEFIGGDLTDIMDYDSAELKTQDLFENPISQDCFALVVPLKGMEIKLFSFFMHDLYFIPHREDFDNPYHKEFWRTNTTVVFECFETALNAMKNYEGFRQNEVHLLAQKEEEEFNYEKAQFEFFDLSDLHENIDVKFLNELTDFVESKHLSFERMSATTKFFLLDKYKTL